MVVKAEIVSRLDREVVKELVGVVGRELLQRLGDDRWPVRDAACCGIGEVVLSFSDELDQKIVEETLSLVFDKQLIDCIPSVRENAAVAVVKVIRCPNGPISALAQQRGVDFLKENMLLLLKNPETADASLPAGMVRGANGAVMKSFLPMAMMKGSPANAVIASPPSRTLDTPFPSSRAKWSCCIDCVELRNSLDWERSHGAVYLVRELALSSAEDMKYVDLLTQPCLPVNSMRSEEVVSPLHALWMILGHRHSPPPDASNSSGAANSSFRNQIRNLEKLQSAIYNEVPRISVVLIFTIFFKVFAANCVESCQM